MVRVLENHRVVSRTKIKVSPCVVGKPNLQYSWQVFRQGIPSQDIISTSSKSNAHFTLDKYTLLPNTKYTFEVKVLDLSSGGSSSHSVDVRVEQGAIRARLLGGNERNATEDGGIVLDLSNSYDEDWGDDSSGRIGFSYTCMQLLPVISETSCMLDIRSLPPQGRGYFDVSPKVNSTDSVSIITFIVRSLDGIDRSDTLDVNVRVIPSTAPVIEFTDVIERVNVDQKISISAQFSATEAAQAIWSLSVFGSKD